MKQSKPINIAFQIIRRWSIFNALVIIFIGANILAFELSSAQILTNKEDWEHAPYSPYFSTTGITVLLDGHSHTMYSDGELTPEESILWHIANGYNAAIITDHNTLQGALKTREIARGKFNTSFKVIPGLEWTTKRIHLNIFGISEEFIDYFSSGNFSSVPKNPTDSEIQNIINLTHAKGGLVIVDHYQRSSLEFGAALPSRNQLLSWGVDYFEVVNSKDHVYFGFDQDSQSFCVENNLGVIAGTDMHIPTTTVHGWTLLSPETFSEDGIFNTIKQKNTTIIYDYHGAPYSAEINSNGWYAAFKPTILVGKAFKDNIKWPLVDWLSVGIILFYSTGIFAVWEANKYLFRKNKN